MISALELAAVIIRVSHLLPAWMRVILRVDTMGTLQTWESGRPRARRAWSKCSHGHTASRPCRVCAGETGEYGDSVWRAAPTR
jgi:hypothetical protein